MTPEVSTVDADVPLLRAIGIMAKRAISCVVVCEGPRPIGIVSERDLVRKLFTPERDPAKLHVRDVMTTPLQTVTREASILDALQALRTRRFRRLPVVDPDGALVGIVTQTDLLHAVITNMEEADRIKAHILSTVSHELRTPITLIAGYVDLLGDGAFEPSSPQQRDIVGRVQRSTAQLVDLVNGAFELIQVQDGRATVACDSIDLAALFEQLRREFGSFLPDSVSLDWRNEIGTAHILGDKAKIKTVLRSLMDNALKFTFAGSVQVTAARSGECVTFTIQDTGIGIPPADLPPIFDMFYQGDSSDTRRFGGVGLGLHVVKRLVELLGGTIAVDSTPGVGTTFRVKLPRAA